MSGSSRTWALLFALALLPRLLFWLEWNRAGLLAIPVVDADDFDRAARGLLRGTWPGAEPFWQGPLYSVFLAGIYRVFGESWAAARFVQAVLGALICVLVYALASSLGARRDAVGPDAPRAGSRFRIDRRAILAFAVCALYGPLIYFEGQLLRSVLGTALLLTWVFVQMRALEDRRARWWAASGALIGLSALVLENLLVLVPLAFFWGIAREWRGRPRGPLEAFRGPVLFVLAAAIVIAPVTISNARREPGFVLISSNGGVNFWLGNNPDSRRMIEVRPGRQWDLLVDRPRREAGAHTAAQRSSFFTREALGWIVHRPDAFLGNTARKTLALLSAQEIRRNIDPYEARRESALLRVLLWKAGPFGFPFGIVGPLALFGLVLALRRRGEAPSSLRSGGSRLRFVAAVALTYGAGVVLFFPSARYRIPLVPFCAVFAAFAASELATLARRRESGTGMRPALAAGILVAAILLVDGGWVRAPEDPGDSSFLRGSALLRAGRDPEATSQLEEATRLAPRNADAWTALAAAYGRNGRSQESARAALSAIAADSTDAQAWTGLCASLVQAGEPERAESAVRRALAIDPDLPQAWINLGTLRNSRGDPAGAEEAFRRALALDSGLNDARAGLAAALGAAGRTGEARSLLSDALRRQPGDAGLWLALGNLEGHAANWPAAAAAFQHAVESAPGNPDAWNNYGLVLEIQGRAPDARRAYNEALRVAPGHAKARENLNRLEAAGR